MIDRVEGRIYYTHNAAGQECSGKIEDATIIQRNGIAFHLPFEERTRLMPYMIETHIRHLEQARALAIRAHRQQLKEIDDWIDNLKRDLEKKLK